MTAEMEHWTFPPRYDESYVPTPQQEHWFPVRETMDPAERGDAILARLREVMRYAYDRSPFYRRKWSAVGLEPEDVRSLADFERVPVVTKAEIREDQAQHPPFGSYLCVGEEEIARIHGTSGTTGRPTAFGISPADWKRIAEAHARVMWGMGVRPSDIVFVGSFFSLYLGSWGALAGAERLGARAFPFGAGIAGQTLRAVNWMRQMRPTVFYGTPSYALRIAEVAAEHGVDPREFGLRILFFSGEPGASVPSVRARIQEAYGARVADAGSMAEMTPWMHLGETSGQLGMLCWQDIVYTEVCDPATQRRVPYGSQGTPVYTHLERTSQPMIRLLSGDLTHWEAGPSACGRTYPILPNGIYGRIDDMVTIRGENVYPAAIEEVVTALDGYGGEHRIVVTRETTMDELTVQVEHRADLGSDAIEELRASAADALRAKLGVSANVEAVPAGTFERTDFKARRVVDRRALTAEVSGA